LSGNRSNFSENKVTSDQKRSDPTLRVCIIDTPMESQQLSLSLKEQKLETLLRKTIDKLRSTVEELRHSKSQDEERGKVVNGLESERKRLQEENLKLKQRLLITEAQLYHSREELVKLNDEKIEKKGNGKRKRKKVRTTGKGSVKDGHKVYENNINDNDDDDDDDDDGDNINVSDSWVSDDSIEGEEVEVEVEYEYKSKSESDSDSDSDSESEFEFGLANAMNVTQQIEIDKCKNIAEIYNRQSSIESIQNLLHTYTSIPSLKSKTYINKNRKKYMKLIEWYQDKLACCDCENVAKAIYRLAKSEKNIDMIIDGPGSSDINANITESLYIHRKQDEYGDETDDHSHDGNDIRSNPNFEYQTHRLMLLPERLVCMVYRHNDGVAWLNSILQYLEAILLKAILEKTHADASVFSWLLQCRQFRVNPIAKSDTHTATEAKAESQSSSSDQVVIQVCIYIILSTTVRVNLHPRILPFIKQLTYLVATVELPELSFKVVTALCRALSETAILLPSALHLPLVQAVQCIEIWSGGSSNRNNVKDNAAISFSSELLASHLGLQHTSSNVIDKMRLSRDKMKQEKKENDKDKSEDKSMTSDSVIENDMCCLFEYTLRNGLLVNVEPNEDKEMANTEKEKERIRKRERDSMKSDIFTDIFSKYSVVWKHNTTPDMSTSSRMQWLRINHKILSISQGLLNSIWNEKTNNTLYNQCTFTFDYASFSFMKVLALPMSLTLSPLGLQICNTVLKYDNPISTFCVVQKLLMTTNDIDNNNTGVHGLNDGSRYSDRKYCQEFVTHLMRSSFIEEDNQKEQHGGMNEGSVHPLMSKSQGEDAEKHLIEFFSKQIIRQFNSSNVDIMSRRLICAMRIGWDVISDCISHYDQASDTWYPFHTSQGGYHAHAHAHTHSTDKKKSQDFKSNGTNTSSKMVYTKSCEYMKRKTSDLYCHLGDFATAQGLPGPLCQVTSKLHSHLYTKSSDLGGEAADINAKTTAKVVRRIEKEKQLQEGEYDLRERVDYIHDAGLTSFTSDVLLEGAEMMDIAVSMLADTKMFHNQNNNVDISFSENIDDNTCVKERCVSNDHDTNMNVANDMDITTLNMIDTIKQDMRCIASGFIAHEIELLMASFALSIRGILRAITSYSDMEALPSSLSQSQRVLIGETCIRTLMAVPFPWGSTSRVTLVLEIYEATRVLYGCAKHSSPSQHLSLSPPIDITGWLSLAAVRIPVFVINLDRRYDRWRRMKIMCEAHGLIPIRIRAWDSQSSLFDCQRYPNRDGTMSARVPSMMTSTATTTTEPSYFTDMDNIVNKTWDSTLNSQFDNSCHINTALPMTESERACAASHAKVWNIIVRSSHEIFSEQINKKERLKANDDEVCGDDDVLLALQGLRSLQLGVLAKSEIREVEVINTLHMNEDASHDRNHRSCTGSNHSERDFNSSNVGLTTNSNVVDKNEWYIILEDDASPCIHIPNNTSTSLISSSGLYGGHSSELYTTLIRQALDRTPSSTDIVYLGHAIPSKGIVRKLPKKGLIQVKYLWQMHAYAISKHTAKLLIEHLPIDSPLDNFVAKLIYEGSLNAYAVLNKLMKQTPLTHNSTDIVHSGRLYTSADERLQSIREAGQGHEQRFGGKRKRQDTKKNKITKSI
jgi:GR25 family glycosyltransferase involved in LPS biosynthesis